MPGQESPAELRPGLQWNEETLWFDALQSRFGVWVFLPFFLCICIPGSPGEFIYLLHEEEGEAGQGAKLKNGSSTRYCPELGWRRSGLAADHHVPCRRILGEPSGPMGNNQPPGSPWSVAGAGAASTRRGSDSEPRRLLEDGRTYLIKNINTTARSLKHLRSPWCS